MLQATYNPWLVLFSVLVGIGVSFAALQMTLRARERSGPSTWLWSLGAAVVLGSGAWSAHFIGMTALQTPVVLTYDVATALAALGLAIALPGCGLALGATIRTHPGRIGPAALLLGMGACTVHYTAMYALRVRPVPNAPDLIVVGSLFLSLGTAFAALTLAFRDKVAGMNTPTRMFIAAILLGSTDACTHFADLTTREFSAASINAGGVALGEGWLAAMIALFALGLLGLALVTAFFDAQLASHTRLHEKRLEQASVELQHQATHDALTGLPNRLLLVDHLRQAVTAAAGNNRAFAAMALDLDRFKLVNDTLGHGVGDELLARIAARLTKGVRKVDLVARVGGDEFLLIVKDVNTRDEVVEVATNLVETLGTPFRVRALDLHVSASIGIATYPEDGSTAEDLLAHVDEALYHAKRCGGNGFQFFASEMSTLSAQRLDLENDLRRAIAQRQFEVYYQPKVDVPSGRIAGVEALIRWCHPEKGLVAPGEFIAVAEETGLILPIGEWVLQEACRQARAWEVAGLPFLRVSVNLSPAQFHAPDLVETIRHALQANDLDPRFLELELTEGLVMTNAEGSVEILKSLSRMGIVVSVDDFGTGYSSMSYLRRFPIDKLKIDRSFIADLPGNQDAAAIVRAIVSLAHGLRLKVIAEGVETREQLDLLRDMGCDQYQGYYCSRPVPAAALEALVRRSVGFGTPWSEADAMRTYSKLAAYRPRPSVRQ